MPTDPPEIAALTGEPILDLLIAVLRTRPGVVTLAYHEDADPGDGSGWCIEVGDRRFYGHLAANLRRHLETP